MTRQLKFALLAAVVLVAACGSRVNKDNYDKIENGMTQDEVYAILGKPTEVSSAGIGNLSASNEIWKGGTHTITASVRDASGLAATASVSLSVVDRPPPVTIAAPADGSFFPRGFSVGFAGSVVDDLDGDLSASLRWSSHRDGFIGMGPSIASAALSPGDHMVRAEVTNSLGTTGAATGPVTVPRDEGGERPPAGETRH